MIDLSKNEKLSKEQLREIAPSIFSTTPSPEVSSKYSHIPTDKLIDDMELLGWIAIDAKEVKARQKSTRGFQKHLVVFRNPEIVINQLPEGITRDDKSPTGYRKADGTFAKANSIDTVFPQILLTNSHDGKNAFTFTAGLFRMICENGLVVSTSTFEDVKMRHMGYSFEELQVKIKEMVSKLPLTVESMNKMQATELGQNEAVSFAKKAISTRFPEKELKRIKIDFKDLLKPVRKEDNGKDLWSVFNVVQEKIIEGDFEYLAAGKTRKARQIKNFKQDQKINKELFELALEYVK